MSGRRRLKSRDWLLSHECRSPLVEIFGLLRFWGEVFDASWAFETRVGLVSHERSGS